MLASPNPPPASLLGGVVLFGVGDDDLLDRAAIRRARAARGEPVGQAGDGDQADDDTCVVCGGIVKPESAGQVSGLAKDVGAYSCLSR